MYDFIFKIFNFDISNTCSFRYLYFGFKILFLSCFNNYILKEKITSYWKKKKEVAKISIGNIKINFHVNEFFQWEESSIKVFSPFNQAKKNYSLIIYLFLFSLIFYF
jgi:hypothetical protein